jgi:hypothetical protein
LGVQPSDDARLRLGAHQLGQDVRIEQDHGSK